LTFGPAWLILCLMSSEQAPKTAEKRVRRRRASFGAVYRLKRRDGTRYDGWFVRFVEAGKRVQRGGFATKDAAEDFLAGQRVESSGRRALGLAELRRVSVEEAVRLYLEWSKEHRRPRTHKSNRTYLDALAAKWGRRDLISLTGDDVVRALEVIGRERRWKPATMHCGLTTMGAFLRWATQERYARDGVLRGARRRLPRADVESPPYLSPEEIRVVYAAVPEEIRPAVVLMGEAGLRRDEAVYLRWDELARDLSNVTIRGERSKGHRARTVPLTALAKSTLGPVLGDRAIPIDGSTRVFSAELTSHRLNHLFRAACDRVGRSDVTPHTLRHAFGSGLVRAGVDLASVQRLLGHRSIQMTMRYACHAPANAGTLAIAALEASRGHAPLAGTSPSAQTS
jgi:integrase